VIKRHFIDAGAYTGDTVRLFLDKVPEADQYEIHCFEPDLRIVFDPQLIDRVHLYPSAVWVKDGTVDLFVGKPESSSVFGHKTTGHLSPTPITVPCIDFSRWLDQHIGVEEKVILKLDIEGAEYAVLNHLLKTGAIDAISQLYVDWHWNKIGIDCHEHEALVKKLLELGLVAKTMHHNIMEGY